MRIVHTAAGAAGGYCGVCVRDAAVVRGLRQRGHQVMLLPMYTPLQLDAPDEPDPGKICFGGVNVFFQQYLPFARWSAFRIFDRILDHPRFLARIAKGAVETRPEKLGAMTVSMLAGISGRQRREIAKMIAYLQAQPSPEAIILTNILLSGLAPALRTEFSCPVVCNLQGGEAFIQRLGTNFTEQALTLIRANAECIDRFTVTYAGYADEASALYGIERHKIEVVPPCLDDSLYTTREKVQGKAGSGMFTVGFLSRLCADKGLDIVARGFMEFLRACPEPGARLLLAGTPGGDKSRLLRQLQQEFAAAGVQAQVEFRQVLSLAEKLAFLYECDVFCLPSRIKERRAIACLEAMAAGIPVIVSANGILPEMITRTGGGLLLRENSPRELGVMLLELRRNPEPLPILGTAAAAGVRRCFSVDCAAAAVEKILFSV